MVFSKVRFFALITIIASALLLSGCNDDSSSSSGGGSKSKARGDFDLTFKQTVMPCASCGIWFDSTELVIQHTEGTYKKRQGTMFVKKASGKVGHFKADLSSIPAGAEIISATLYMRLHPHEGIANGDNGSVIAVTDANSKFVRNISAKHDIKGKGYSKGNPNVPIDFTAYAKKL